MDIGDGALVAGDGRIEFRHIIMDDGGGVHCQAEDFRFHGNGVSVPLQGNGDVHALFMLFLPVIPALEVRGLFRFNDVFRMGIGQPGFPVQAEQAELPEAVSGYQRVVRGKDDDKGTVPVPDGCCPASRTVPVL